MSRPNIIRADTLDLQDHNTPSAKDHRSQPAHPAPLGEGPPAPHQEASLRHAQEDRAAEQDYLVDQWGGERESHEGSELMDEDTDLFTDSTNVHPDDQAIQQNGGLSRSSEDSDMTDADEDNVDDDMVDKISSSPSIDDEDIDFEFVYALHTFVATVEGQANATKGDTMQLLDDSNSYWWLVRVCKDSSIGYLPAEHIETPTERLARLNKHRNGDLSREHLGDSDIKPKSMFKQALKRRTAKMVQFTTPTFYDAPEVDWSDDDQDSADAENDPQDERGIHGNSESEQTSSSEPASTAQSAESAAAAAVQNAAPSPSVAVAELNPLSDPERVSNDSLEPSDSVLRRSRNGNIRNTDSFFKDETAEPKKMSLTPSILRDAEQAGAASKLADPKEKIVSPISDTFENSDKTSPTSDKFKDDKKKKKEKSGMLSGLFKRKEKKIKVDEAAGGTVRTSQSDLESMLASPTASSPNESNATSPKEQSPSSSRRPSAAGGKLVKSPPSSMISSQTGANSASGSSRGSQAATAGDARSSVASSAPRSGIDNVDAQSGRQPLRIQTGASTTPSLGAVNAAVAATASSREETPKKESGILSPLSSLRRDPNEPKKEKLKKAPQRMELDVDSSPEREPTPLSNYRNAAHTPPPRMAPSAPRQEPFDKNSTVSPVKTNALPERDPPALDSSKSIRSESPVSPSTPTESTSTINTPETASEEPKTSTAPTSTTPDSKGHNRQESEDDHWDDATLHRYLETQAETDVKDMLLRIYDTNEVKPVGRDHPFMKPFEEPQKMLDDLMKRLDRVMLETYSRKEGKGRKGGVERVGV